MTQLPVSLSTLVDGGLDLFRALSGPIAAGIRAYVQRRIDEARSILLEELGRGDILPPQAARK